LGEKEKKKNTEFWVVKRRQVTYKGRTVLIRAVKQKNTKGVKDREGEGINPKSYKAPVRSRPPLLLKRDGRIPAQGGNHSRVQVNQKKNGGNDKTSRLELIRKRGKYLGKTDVNQYGIAL